MPSQQETSLPQLRARGAITQCGAQSKGHRGIKQVASASQVIPVGFPLHRAQLLQEGSIFSFIKD